MRPSATSEGMCSGRGPITFVYNSYVSLFTVILKDPEKHKRVIDEVNQAALELGLRVLHPVLDSNG